MRNKLFAYGLFALALMAILSMGHGTALAEDNSHGVKNSTATNSDAGPSPASYGPAFHRRPGHPPGPGFHRGPARGHGMKNGPGPDSTESPRHKKVVTPYGDFCPLCTPYGMGKKAVGMDHAMEALTGYFKSKGLDIKNVKGRGRFLRAEVYHQGILVDKILFDRRTGRIRSIY